MLLTLILSVLIAQSAAVAQGVEVRLADTGATAAFAEVGDTLSVEVAVDLGDLHVSGVALFLSLPSRGLSLVQPAGPRPFAPQLFAEGMEFANERVPAERAYGVPRGAFLLTYAVVLGPGEGRYRSGRGPVATLKVVCTEPMDAGAIGLFSNPIHTSMLVLDDGRTELGLVETAGMAITVAEPAAKRAGGTWGAAKRQFHRRVRQSTE